jgi:allene oxide cyclase-like protein
MRRPARLAILGVVLLAAGLVLHGTASGAASTASDRNDEVTTLRFDVRFSPFDLIDIGTSGLSAGDQIVFHDMLLRHGKRVGDEVGSCVVVESSGLSNCTGVVRLPQGNITFAFPNSPPPRKTLAITGGTGRYRTAHGDGLLVESATGPVGTLTLHVIR